jgi:hypothetical protein
LKPKTLTSSNASKDGEQQELSVITGGNQMDQLFWKKVWWFLTNLSIISPCDPEVALFGTYSKEMKIYVLSIQKPVHKRLQQPHP